MSFGPGEIRVCKVTLKVTFAWYRNEQPEITCTILALFKFLQQAELKKLAS